MPLVPPSPPTPPALPAACADCTTTLQLAKPGSVPQQVAYKMSRSADGKMRIDYGATSVITDPASGKMMLLDHVKKEVKTLPIPQQPAAPQLAPPAIPGMAAPPSMPSNPASTAKDLGKRIVGGVEVEGKQFTMPSLAAPKPPAPPQVPGMPGAPQMPPKPDPKAMVAEVWTSTQHQVPVLTRITGDFGQQMCHCKNVTAGEPHPSAFQVPADYKQIGPPTPPAPPKLPSFS